MQTRRLPPPFPLLLLPPLLPPHPPPHMSRCSVGFEFCSEDAEIRDYFTKVHCSSSLAALASVTPCMPGQPASTRQALAGARRPSSHASCEPRPFRTLCSARIPQPTLHPFLQVWDSLVALFYTRILEEKSRREAQHGSGPAHMTLCASASFFTSFS
jgi:hypothetical protein